MKLSESFLNSYDIEYYLGRILLESDFDSETKKKRYDFLSKYLFKGLFVCEYMDDKQFLITIENEDDEIIDDMVLYTRDKSC
jgi:hypothetical protein